MRLYSKIYGTSGNSLRFQLKNKGFSGNSYDFGNSGGICSTNNLQYGRILTIIVLKNIMTYSVHAHVL